MLTTVVTSY